MGGPRVMSTTHYDQQESPSYFIKLLGDANVMALRTSETLDALADVLVATLALVPAMDVPSELRKAAESFPR
jgi:hypothetical protein